MFWTCCFDQQRLGQGVAKDRVGEKKKVAALGFPPHHQHHLITGSSFIESILRLQLSIFVSTNI